MYLAGYTMQEIADVVGVDRKTIERETTDIYTRLEKSPQLLSNFQDSEFETPIAYQVNTSF